MGVAVTIQAPGIILPRVAPLGTEVEIVADLLTHISLEFPAEYLEYKTIHIMATEALLAPGVPGNLLCWIELSPFPSVNSGVWPAPLPATAFYWAAIGGGGGGFLPPIAPQINEAGLGVALQVHTMFIPWLAHSAWARLVVQTPIPNPVAFWGVQAIISGKGG